MIINISEKMGMMTGIWKAGSKKLTFVFEEMNENHYCPVKFQRFLPTVEMTRCLEYFGRVEGGGGEATTTLHPKQRNCLSFRSANRRRGI